MKDFFFFLFNEILKYDIMTMYNNKEKISNSIFSAKNWFKNSNTLFLKQNICKKFKRL